jgi:DNA repair exonuclease SbcCD ATPase subunit
MDFAQVERESLIAIKAELHKLEFDSVIYTNLQGQIRAQRHAEFRYQQLQRDLSELKKLTDELPPIEQKAQELADQLTSQTFAAELKEALQAVEEKIAGLDYDRDRHIELKDKLLKTTPSSDLFLNLERARSETPTLQQSLDSCMQSLASKTQQIADLDAETKSLELTLSGLPTLQDEIAKLQPALADFRSCRPRIETSAIGSGIGRCSKTSRGAAAVTRRIRGLHLSCRSFRQERDSGGDYRERHPGDRN